MPFTAVLFFVASFLLAPARAEESLGVQASDAFANGDYTRAVELADEAFRTGQVSRIAMPTTLAIRAMAHAHLGEAKEAWADVADAFSANAMDYFVYYGAAEVSRLLDQPRRGVGYATTGLRLAPGFGSLWALRADLLAALGQDDLADADRRRAEELDAIAGPDIPGDGDARYDCNLGADLRCAQGLFPLVADSKAAPGSAALLGYLLLTLDAADDGQDLLLWAGQAQPQAPETWLYVGLAALRGDDLPAAREAFRQALTLDPLDVRAGLGLIAAMPEDTMAAVAEWEGEVAGLPLDESQHAILALQSATDWQRAADQASDLFRANVGPFAMVAVYLLAGDSLPLDRRRALLSAAITPQSYLRDTFIRQLATLERERLLGG